MTSFSRPLLRVTDHTASGTRQRGPSESRAHRVRHLEADTTQPFLRQTADQYRAAIDGWSVRRESSRRLGNVSECR